jgi:hypothetical protein
MEPQESPVLPEAPSPPRLYAVRTYRQNPDPYFSSAPPAYPWQSRLISAIEQAEPDEVVMGEPDYAKLLEELLPAWRQWRDSLEPPQPDLRSFRLRMLFSKGYQRLAAKAIDRPDSQLALNRLEMEIRQPNFDLLALQIFWRELISRTAFRANEEEIQEWNDILSETYMGLWIDPSSLELAEKQTTPKNHLEGG